MCRAGRKKESMIQANEAIVGHWFNRKHGKGWSWHCLTEQDLVSIFYENGDLALDVFEPIPLTPEILKKAGFGQSIRDGMDVWSVKMNEKFFLQWHDDGSILMDTEHGIREVTDARYYHLHQLQNLYYALTGSELNIHP